MNKIVIILQYLTLYCTILSTELVVYSYVLFYHFVVLLNYNYLMCTDTSSLEHVVLCVIVIILILQYYTLCNAPVSQLNQTVMYFFIFF